VICICIRDEEDVFVLAKTTSVSPMCSVPVGESLRLFKALEWLSDMFFYNVDFVLDSKVNMYAFNQCRADVSEFGQIISAWDNYSPHTSQIIRSISTCDKQMRWLTIWRGLTHYQLVSLFILIYLCIEQFIINKMFFWQN